MVRSVKAKVGRGTLSPAVNARVRALLEDLVEAEGGRGFGGVSRVAKRVGRSQGRISAILNGDGATGELAAAVCEAAGVAEHTIFSPKECADDLSKDASLNRAKAVKAARLIGLSEAAIREVQAMPIPTGTDDALGWLEQMIPLHRRAHR